MSAAECSREDTPNYLGLRKTFSKGQKVIKKNLNWIFFVKQNLNIDIAQSIKLFINGCTILFQLTLVIFQDAYNYLV